ncbi:RNA polymerase sigma-70 factor (ECF subfamily) [Chitinophaga polysaccharea]|uniref:RNA polymerase sigma-70 factor (ECF subfamily) n=1 Tax=Chitinophaga polysaccharea TaxID=1293035 RepID=A0A561PGH9_9BACT|nr:RNA polymerase sigma-70 factor [Chitinophaga polysaccharea]TWF37209.1 RNA polymerase sigma-70 factor (ECF subfamily) [Chitinophaga polysaccharea]
MYSSYSDNQLVSLLKSDDSAAFNAIYDRYSKMLYLFIHSKLDAAEISKDVLQELFISLWEKRHSLVLKESLKAYLYQVARHKIIDIYRKNATYRKYLQQLIEHFDAQPHSIADTVDNKVRTQELFEAINHLPERMKEIFMLSRFENLSVEQISNHLGLSQQTVKNQITKALKILRASYAKTDLILLCVVLIRYFFI